RRSSDLNATRIEFAAVGAGRGIFARPDRGQEAAQAAEEGLGIERERRGRNGHGEGGDEEAGGETVDGAAGHEKSSFARRARCRGREWSRVPSERERCGRREPV